MATYNGAKFIEKQVISILKQIEVSDEIIVSDDSSTDDTLDILLKIDDPRIKIYKNAGFRNAVLNFEYALSKAKGSYIFLADQDDIWLEGRVDFALKALKSYDLVVCDAEFIHADGTIYSNTPSFFNLYQSGSGFLKNFVKNTYIGNCMAFRRSVLEFSLPFPRALHRFPNLDHGYWIGILSNLHFKVEFIPVVLVLYRRHESNVSPTTHTLISPYSFSSKLMSRLNLAVALIKHCLEKT
nr:hypothetical protein A6C57_05920 [Fibrella sp. ES10-3-2-2]